MFIKTNKTKIKELQIKIINVDIERAINERAIARMQRQIDELNTKVRGIR